MLIRFPTGLAITSIGGIAFSPFTANYTIFTTASSPRKLHVIMPLASHNLEFIVHDSKYDSILFIDADTPPPRKILLQWLGAAYAIVTVPLNALYERIDALDSPPITAALPCEIVIPTPVMPNLMHEQDP